jgi:AraC-like DNA-binding protein
MLDHSSTTRHPHGDSLTVILRGLRLDGIDYGRCELREPWAVRFPAQQAARFHFVGGKSCWLLQPSGKWVELGVGDAVLLPRGAEHVMASAPHVPPVPFETYDIKEVCEDIFDIQGGGDGESSLLFCGSMRFNVDSLHPLLRMMPDVMRAHNLAEKETTIPYLLDAMAREITADRIGASGLLARLADVLAASIIRLWVEHESRDATGWIAAVRNPEIGRVIVAIHLNPEHDWTVPRLAKVMGASRSSFAERFVELVGETPARYVSQVRMHQARQWLARDRLRISAVARRLGYDSEASFSRAFKRVIGVAPSQVRGEG